jgi:Tfp pilus assembly protein PilX
MKNERGFALITALSIAILYFGLMELMVIDSMRTLREAQRFKARVVAQALAESGAELAALDLVRSFRRVANEQDWQGEYSGRLMRSANTFELQGSGTTSGIVRQTATVRLNGRIVGNDVIIDYAVHSQ